MSLCTRVYQSGVELHPEILVSSESSVSLSERSESPGFAWRTCSGKKRQRPPGYWSEDSCWRRCEHIRAMPCKWKDVERCGKMWKGLLDHRLGICPKDVKYSHTAYNPRRLIESVESKTFSMGNCVCMQVSCLLLSGCLHIFPFYKWACRVPGSEGSRRLWYHSHHFIARQCVQREKAMHSKTKSWGWMHPNWTWWATCTSRQ